MLLYVAIVFGIPSPNPNLNLSHNFYIRSMLSCLFSGPFASTHVLRSAASWFISFFLRASCRDVYASVRDLNCCNHFWSSSRAVRLASGLCLFQMEST